MKYLVGSFPILFGSILLGAPNPETTVIPLGLAQIPKGVSQPKYILPTSPEGPLHQALVFVASKPRGTVAPPAVVAPTEGIQKEGQVPATLKFTVAGKELPPWKLEDYATAYVINYAALKANPLFAQSQLELKIELITDVEGMGIPIFGMPDPLLLNDEYSGPLSEFIEKASAPEVKSYFRALSADLASRRKVPSDWQAARDEYQKLVASKNEWVGRLARRGLRKISFDLRPHNPSGNFNERYRWGLYLQQCGLFSPAFTEFDQCRTINPSSVDSCFRAADLIERLNGGVVKTMDYLERAGMAANFQDPATWYSLVIIQRKRGDRTLTNDELKSIKINWLLVQADVWGATEGRLKIVNSFYEVPDSDSRNYVEYAPGLDAPAEDIVQARGWFDSVISVRPRLPEEAGRTTTTVGGDRGPKGAALSAIYHDAPWPEFYRAWFEHFSWAVNVGEQFKGMPEGRMPHLCGLQPLQSDASGCRAALRYYLTNVEYPRPRICDESRSGECVRLWQIEGPFPVTADKKVDPMAHHVNQSLTASGDVRTLQYESPRDFINLKKIFGKGGPALARATTWVFSPTDQTVRMWIGQNDGVSISLNNRLIHEGRYYSAHNYEDKDIVDTIAGWAPLKRGWNELSVVTEGWPAPRDKGWGFSIRFCTPGNEPVAGLAFLNKAPTQDLVPAYRPPSAGTYYDWEEVKENFREALPQLTDADLQKITGISDLSFTHKLTTAGGFCALTSGQKPESPYRVPPTWNTGKDSDYVLNNVLDWMREASAVVRYEKGGIKHDLLLMKPEMIDAYLQLIKESPASASAFKKEPISRRILGYVLIKDENVELPVFVLDAMLNVTDKWPLDEEDLLEPISPVFVPNKGKSRPAPGPPTPKSK